MRAFNARAFGRFERSGVWTLAGAFTPQANTSERVAAVIHNFVLRHEPFPKDDIEPWIPIGADGATKNPFFQRSSSIARIFDQR